MQKNQQEENDYNLGPASDAERHDWAHNSSRDPDKHPDRGSHPMRHLSKEDGLPAIPNQSRSRGDGKPGANQVQPQNVQQLEHWGNRVPPDHEDLPTTTEYRAEHGARQPDRSDERTHRVTQPLVSPTQITPGAAPVPAQPLSTTPSHVPAVKTETTPTGGVKKA